MNPQELSVDFTTEELLFLSERLGLRTPPGLGTSAVDSLPDEVRQVLRDQAESALLARRVLVGSEEQDPAPVDAVTTLLSTLSQPALLVTASFEQDGIVETRFYGATPELGVEHRSLAVSLHRLIPFATRDVLSRVLSYLDLRPGTSAAVVGFTVPLAALEAASAKVTAHDHDGAVAALTNAGAAEDAADEFVEALKLKRATASVTVLYRPEDAKVAGGQLTWLDAGLRGLWLTDATEADQLEVRPVTGTDIAQELLGFLPQPFAERPRPVPEASE